MSDPGVVATCSPKKVRLAHAMSRTRTLRLIRALENRRPFLRVLNLHSVPASYEPRFRQLIEYLLERFEPADPFDLTRLLDDGPMARSHILLTFDDGLSNHAEVAAPILEEYGIRAIFSLPVRFLDLPEDEQLTWFRKHVYPLRTELHSDQDVRAMTWPQALDLVRHGHRICSHGVDHRRLSADTTTVDVASEIEESLRLLKERLPDIAVEGFCWPIRFDSHARAADALVRTTYQYALCGDSRPLRTRHDLFRIYRTNVEVSWPRAVIDFQLSGAMDVRFALRQWIERGGS